MKAAHHMALQILNGSAFAMSLRPMARDGKIWVCSAPDFIAFKPLAERIQKKRAQTCQKPLRLRLLLGGAFPSASILDGHGQRVENGFRRDLARKFNANSMKNHEHSRSLAMNLVICEPFSSCGASQRPFESHDLPGGGELPLPAAPRSSPSPSRSLKHLLLAS